MKLVFLKYQNLKVILAIWTIETLTQVSGSKIISIEESCPSKELSREHLTEKFKLLVWKNMNFESQI